jgi:hypothetical protein
MMHVLATGMPILRPVLRSRVLRLLLTPLYKIITYNRRLIAGTRAPARGFDCAPDRHPGWRWTYILLATSAMLLLGLPLIPVLALLMVGLGLLWPADDRMSVLGQPVTVGLSLAVLHTLLPVPLALPVVCMVLGVEVHRRFGWSIPAVS